MKTRRESPSRVLSPRGRPGEGRKLRSSPVSPPPPADAAAAQPSRGRPRVLRSPPSALPPLNNLNANGSERCLRAATTRPEFKYQ